MWLQMGSLPPALILPARARSSALITVVAPFWLLSVRNDNHSAIFESIRVCLMKIVNVNIGTDLNISKLDGGRNGFISITLKA